MRLRGLGAMLGNRLWQLFSYAEYRRFRDGTDNLRGEQENQLKRALGRLQGTAWGKRYQVSGDWDYQRFHAEIPPHSYEDLLPFLKLPNGLLKESIRLWEPTGGSTGGCKWIPWTQTLQGDFRRAVAAWVCDLFSTCPGLRDGRSYWQLTPSAPVRPPDWLTLEQVGFQSDGDYLGAAGRLLEKLVLVTANKRDNRFWQQTVESLKAASDLRLLSCWSPSFLLVLRAKFEEHLGAWEPGLWWPHLYCVSCWTQGPSESLRGHVESLFPGVWFQGKGLLSTEAVTTIPFAGVHPLAYRSHFFEFLTDDGEVYPSWSLDNEGEYEVLQTTSGGLVRYQSGDRVRVTGHLGRVPCLEFLGRRGVSDLFGEKLSLVYLESLLAEWPGFSAFGFEDGGYVLFLGGRFQGDGARLFGRQVSQRLDQVFTYRDCRELGQLQDLRTFLVQGSAWEQMMLRLGDGFARSKPGVVLPQGRWSEHFVGTFLEGAKNHGQAT
jgi:GH3 auxin-responsive promoter